MDSINGNSRFNVQLPARAPNQWQRMVEENLNKFEEKWKCGDAQALTGMKECFMKMWEAPRAKNDPSTLFKEQLNLLLDLDDYADPLRIACLDVTMCGLPNRHEEIFASI